MWGTDLTTTITGEGQAAVFVAVDHCSAECVGIHAHARATRFQALEPIRQGVRQHFGGFAKAIARGLAVRHDHGSQYMSDHFQKEFAFLGIESSPAFVRAPEGNGCAERFIRTLKENLLWVRTFETIEELRQALLAFRETYNTTWLIERHGFLTPAQFRQKQLQTARHRGVGFNPVSQKPRAVHPIGIVSHIDMLPTLLAAAGDPDVTQKLLDGCTVGGKKFNVHLDGYNQIPYLTGEVKESPRQSLVYFSDDGDVMAVRVGDYKFILAEQRQSTMRIWQEPLVKLRVPTIINLRRDPFERADYNSNTYWDWMVDHIPQMYLMQEVVAEQIAGFVKFPPRQRPASFNLDAVMAQVAVHSHS